MKIYLHVKSYEAFSYWGKECSLPIIVGAYFNKRDAQSAAKQKNEKAVSYRHFVKTINVKGE